MHSIPTFFTLIIGTEILNRRREDKHFDFVSTLLSKKGVKLSGSFIIEDDPALIVQSIKFIASQPNPVLFSFGGIGSTPDDYTRKCVAIALRDGILHTHPQAKQIIEETLKENAYPHPIKMAQLPKGATLLHNPVNNMPAFALDERYFFMPGFPEMSHPMVEEIVERLLPNAQTYYRYTLTAHCKENLFIEMMEKMPKEVEVSSLPKRLKEGWSVSLSVASYNQQKAQEAFEGYKELLDRKEISYTLSDEKC